jgi:prophage tail gpP-like protein
MAIKKKYVAKENDRITRIAAAYGVTTQDIINATPNVFTPYRKQKTNELIADGTLAIGEMLFYPGEVLNIPESDADKLALAQTIKADSADELTLYIDNKKVPNPTDFSFTEYFDSCSDSFSLSYPYDKTLTNPIFTVDPNFFQGKGLPDIKIYIGPEVALTGSIEIPAFQITRNSSIQTFAGRSKTLLLEKSDMLPEIKKEYNKASLKDIVSIISKAYGLEYEMQDGVDIGKNFDKAVCEDSETPFAFLTRLSKERSLLIGKTAEGKVLIMKAVSAEPVANFDIDSEFLSFIGVEGLTFTYDTTKIYGQYIGKATSSENVNISSTVQSQILLQQSCKIVKYDCATKTTIQGMTKWEEQRSVREFYNNAIPYPSWINPNTGKRWKSGQFITLRCADTQINDPVVMMIRSIEFTDNSGKRAATLNIVPESTYVDMPQIINNKKSKANGSNESIIDKLGIRAYGAK